jgi:hypothetical protein
MNHPLTQRTFPNLPLRAPSMRTLTLTAVLPALAALAPAQHTILMTSGAADETTLALDLPEIDSINNVDIYQVTPAIGQAAIARPFLPVSLQWHLAGDPDNDGRYVEASVDGPGGSSNVVDEIFVKANTVGPVSHRDVFLSLSAASTMLGTLPSDVFRFSGQGTREVFLAEAQVMTATGGTSLNLDALCQTVAGDLFFSFSVAETLALGAAADGDLLMIPASAITYDGFGNVAAITANSAIRVATETQLQAMVAASGFKTASGGTALSLFNLAGLEVDPNGGTWISPVDTLSYPNVLFCWRDASNDGAILSTAGGGSLAVINGVTMGSTVATNGTHLGWSPGTTGTSGPGGLALIPQQAPFYELLNYPRNLHTAGTGQTFVQLQTSAGTPGGLSIFVWSIESAVAGGSFPSFGPIPGFLGELGISSIILVGAFPNDSLGNSATNLITLPTAVMTGINLAAQALDLTTLTFSTPSGMSFL